MNTALSAEQYDRLDRLAEDHPEAIVVGWLGTEAGGPVIKLDETYGFITSAGTYMPTMRPRTLRTKVNL